MGFSGTDDELLDYTNFTGADQDLILEVRMWGGDASSCNTYTLNVAGSSVGGPGPVGANYCSANANSTGSAASISGFGETRVSANDVTLTASNLPPNQFGIFIVSASQGFVPNAGGTSNGNLCLGGAIGRYVGPGEILSSGAAGEFSLAIDLGVILRAAARRRPWRATPGTSRRGTETASASARTSPTGSRSSSTEVDLAAASTSSRRRAPAPPRRRPSAGRRRGGASPSSVSNARIERHG